MQNANHIKLPKCLISLLTDAGFDSFISLVSLDEARIKNIETFLNENKLYVNKLECCYSDHYKQLQVFEFLPGHKSILLEIPKQVKEFQNRNPNHDARRRNTSTMSNTNVNTSSLAVSASADQLKSLLIRKLMEYIVNVGPHCGFEEDTISDANIHNLESFNIDNQDIWKCKFSCPFCSSSYTLIYKKHWERSNATKHLKKHIMGNTMGNAKNQ